MLEGVLPPLNWFQPRSPTQRRFKNAGKRSEAQRPGRYNILGRRLELGVARCKATLKDCGEQSKRSVGPSAAVKGTRTSNRLGTEKNAMEMKGLRVRSEKKSKRDGESQKNVVGR